jgi:hypothetical protein
MAISLGGAADFPSELIRRPEGNWVDITVDVDP